MQLSVSDYSFCGRDDDTFIIIYYDCYSYQDVRCVLCCTSFIFEMENGKFLKIQIQKIHRYAHKLREDDVSYPTGSESSPLSTLHSLPSSPRLPHATYRTLTLHTHTYLLLHFHHVATATAASPAAAGRTVQQQ